MIRLYNRDCLEAMREMEDNSFDLAIVDPPYGIGIADWDTKKDIPTKEYFKELMRVSRNQIIWGANYFDLPHTQAWVCWDKTYKFKMNIPISEFELAWSSFEHKAAFCRFTYCGNFMGWDNPRADYNKPPNIHPTQKPVALYIWLLEKYAKPGQTILDTHLGSGSIALACHDLGYDLTGFELDEDYFQAASKRLQDHQRQLRLF
jgi:site-specific DNA-methyltransferase (adenine-specific)